MVFGDGSFVRAGLEAAVALLRNFASPTGARGSVLLMTGGLVVLGFLFLAFVFRSAIVGDLAPASNKRKAARRVRLPGEALVEFAPVDPKRASQLADSFRVARQRARQNASSLDAVFESLREQGVDARIVQSGATWKVVRLYRCRSCGGGASGCDVERGLLAGGFEALTGQLAKVTEVSCALRGDARCEFEVKHVAILKVKPE